MLRLSATILGISLLLAEATLTPAQATAIRYTLAFTLTEVSFDAMGGPWANPPDGCIDCYKYLPLVGDLFTGSVALEDSIASWDGARTGGLISMDLNLAGVNWGYTRDAGFYGSLTGFRNTDHEDVSGPIKLSPTFLIEGGDLVGLQGGVYGRADYPFIDFLDSSFRSRDLYSSVILSGDIRFAKVESVPEPSTAWLMPVGLAAVVAAAWRKRKTRPRDHSEGRSRRS